MQRAINKRLAAPDALVGAFTFALRGPLHAVLPDLPFGGLLSRETVAREIDEAWLPALYSTDVEPSPGVLLFIEFFSLQDVLSRQTFWRHRCRSLPTSSFSL
jgi:hypothetical protein